MIEVIFKNDYGEIGMGGKKHPLYKILTLDGLTLPEFTRKTAKYYGEPGQELLNREFEARTITMSVDMVNSESAVSELVSMQKILSVPVTIVIKGTDKYNRKMRKRAIMAECTSFTLDTRNEVYQRIILQFVCDNPYFHDEENTVEYLYTINKLLKGTFMLPDVFSTRTNKGVILNCGDLKTEPIIHLFASEKQGNSAAEERVVIKNNTTGQFVDLSYGLGYNEILSVDIPERRIYSSINPEKDLFCISDDTYLSDFYLIEGANELEVSADTSRYVSVTIEFNNNYREATI